jgi:hypothetical protein
MADNMEDKETKEQDVKIDKVTPKPLRKRVPVHKQKVYDYSMLNLDFKNFHYHWVNSSAIMGNNIERFLNAGYVYVIGKDGKNISRRIGKYEEGNQYLMRLPIDQYNEDQEEKLKEVRKIESDMGDPSGHRSSALSSSHIYGSVKIESKNQ